MIAVTNATMRFLIASHHLFLGRLLQISLGTGLSTVPPEELVECLFAGAGRSCKGIHSQNKRPALADSLSPPQQSWRHHLHSFTAPSKDKTDHLLFLGGSRLRYWLCPSLKRP